MLKQEFLILINAIIVYMEEKTMEWKDILNLVAILLSPIVALGISAYWQKKQDEKGRKMHIFYTLMRTRAQRLHYDHVQALNTIDVEFYDERQVVEAWKKYLDSLEQCSYDNSEAERRHIQKRDDLFTELLQRMATVLKYDFSITDIKNTSYYPVGYGNDLTRQESILTNIDSIVKGDRELAIKIVKNK